jgi:hypothetical protein
MACLPEEQEAPKKVRQIAARHLVPCWLHLVAGFVNNRLFHFTITDEDRILPANSPAASWMAFGLSAAVHIGVMFGFGPFVVSAPPVCSNRLMLPC